MQMNIQFALAVALMCSHFPYFRGISRFKNGEITSEATVEFSPNRTQNCISKDEIQFLF